MDPKLAIAGLFIGLLVGMTGMGGGSLMTPMLVFLFGFKPTVAIGTDILHGAIFKSFGAVRHRQLGTVHLRLTAWMLLGSAPFSLGGVALSTWLKHRYGDGFEDAVVGQGPFKLKGGWRDRVEDRWDRREDRLDVPDAQKLRIRARERAPREPAP